MKPAILGLAFLLLLPNLRAQTSRSVPIPIPDLVMDKFTLLYPDAASIEWMEQDGAYEAEFRNGKMNTTAIIKIDGTVIQTETEIKIIALPPEATSYLLKEIKVKKIEEAIIIEDDPGVITFKAIADDESYWFDSTGQLVGTNEMALLQKGYAEKIQNGQVVSPSIRL